MKTRTATSIAAAVGLALLRAGPSRALSLRSSAAEAFLGDVPPGASAVLSRATGARLRVEDLGPEPVRLEFRIVSPRDAKDGYEPWPDPGRVRVSASRAELKPGEASEADLTLTPPKGTASGAQYEFDVLATARDRAGASLTLKTRVLLSIGAPLPSAGEPPGGFVERPGFQLTPTSAEQASPPRDGGASDAGASVKIVNAGEEDLTVTLSPAREWTDEARLRDGEEAAPNPRWLHFDSETLKVRAGAIARARAWASVPREKRYAGRRWAFVGAVEASGGGRRTRRYFVLHVTTPPLEDGR